MDKRSQSSRLDTSREVSSSALLDWDSERSMPVSGDASAFERYPIDRQDSMRPYFFGPTVPAMEHGKF